ncbi:hypothetical protein BS78_02G100300 [Paspalum vaginatum]|nr:hypothetical protein BS78_02G100300 [Paspalum vaginatum]
MLLPGTTRLLQRLLLLSTIATTHATVILSSSGHDGGNDEGALVAFKAKITGHSGVLASWNQSSSYCSWEGITCSKKHRLRVVALDLSSQGLAGSISPAIGNLTFLRSLNLSSNGLHGAIPPSIGALGRLQRLDLSQNMLTGDIPSNISRCTSLPVMYINSNRGVQGSIPAAIGSMPSLTSLGLANNSLTGTIPSSLGNLSRLTVLYLRYNYLEGSIPAGLGDNPHLWFFQVAINNLSGLLPPSLYNLSSLYELSIADNKLHGSLPPDLGKGFPNIEKIGMGANRFTGALPLSLTNLTKLQVLHIEQNSFTGVVPSELGRLQDLQVLVLEGNEFEANDEQEWGFIASLNNCTGLQFLDIGSNRFAGELPGSLSNLSTNLLWLRAYSNNISGAIPSGIGNLPNLEVLSFSENLLAGLIPESIGKLTQLNQLLLDANRFSGRLPPSVGNLTGLSILVARENSLEGLIPPTIGNLSKLTLLDLSNNKFTGLIPKEIMGLSSISRALDTSYNMLEGPLPLEIGEIPDAIGNCRVLETLLLDGNSFQGSIPATFNNMAGLTQLNLTNNKLNGSIPASLANITNLQELYLAHNNLSGPIPGQLGNSASLLRLDVSFNNLQGDVPEVGVFRNLTGLSIVGNNELCGGIPQLHLPRCPSSTARKNKKTMPKSLKIAIPTIGALLFLLLFVWAGFLYKKFKPAPEATIPQQFTEMELPIISYKDILKATDGFPETNVLGKGRYGTVFKGTLENQDTDVAIKVFNLQISGSYKSFQVECEAIRRVKHRCLVKIITCCSSIDQQGQDFRALIFEFMANGSLDRWIHSNSEGKFGQGALRLSQRLDIAVDIVDALDYLHNGCQPSVIHCDLKPSNILLNQDMRACVGDFGIARVLEEATSKCPINSNSTIAIRGSIGYIAPDVHRETDDMFKDGISLHYYAQAALPNKVMEIADSNIWLHSEANNNNDKTHITRTRECLSAVIQLGVLCSKQLPTERLSMSNAAVQMHAIRDKYISS